MPAGCNWPSREQPSVLPAHQCIRVRNIEYLLLMNAPLNENATCLGCGYRLMNLPSQTCPECGRWFDPSDPTTFGPIQKRRLSIGLVLAFSGIHFVMTIVLFFYSFSKTMEAFDNPSLTSKPITDLANIAVSILMQPMTSLWTKWMSQNIPNAIEFIIFLLNSCIWGIGLAALWNYVRNRRIRTEIIRAQR